MPEVAGVFFHAGWSVSGYNIDVNGDLSKNLVVIFPRITLGGDSLQVAEDIRQSTSIQ